MKQVTVDFDESLIIDCFSQGQVVMVDALPGTISKIVNEKTEIVVPAGEYLCTDFEVYKGFCSGSKEDLNQSGGFLTIKSEPEGSYHYSEWVVGFELPGNKCNALKVLFSGKYSTWRSQSIYAWDYALNTWGRVDYRTLTPSLNSFEFPLDPKKHISSEGFVELRIYVYSTQAFTGFYDMLKLKVS